MARYTGPVCRLCRREGAKLFLKGERCMSEKCAFTRRAYHPGQHGQRRGKFSPYGLQLREKQKAKRIYGLIEGQFRRFFRHAERARGATGTNLLVLLERRLDNMVYRMGFARSRAEARQLIRHNHFVLNGHKVNIPSLLAKANDVLEIRERSRRVDSIKTSLDQASKRGFPGWLEVDAEHFRGKVVAFPNRDEIPMDIREQLIVELYSK
ncbi:MAG: 30S ribosomal protein S4 [Bradymonadales bacterium]|nr:30S ribosomal protein S4 [Bradymonadales bacterium]